MNPFLRQPRAYQRTTIRAEAPASRQDGTVATLRLYDPIDSYGDFWGVSAKEFVRVLDSLPEETTEIRLLINSPGGEAWDGMAILNALRAHPARVTAVVEGIAASAASFIACGVDEVQMMANSTLMIHKAWGLCVGNSDDMTEIAERLTALDRNQASIYIAKAGGTEDEWLAVMSSDKYYSPEEAVAAGLADRVVEPPKDRDPADEARAKFDLAPLRAERTPIPPASEPGQPNRKESDMSDTLLAGLRERLGVTDAAADEGTVLAALDEALAERAETTTHTPAGVVMVDQATMDALRADAALGRAAHDDMVTQRREAAVSAAVADGRIAPARRDHWMAALVADEEGATASLNALEKGLIPIAELGISNSIDADDSNAYPAHWTN